MAYGYRTMTETGFTRGIPETESLWWSVNKITVLFLFSVIDPECSPGQTTARHYSRTFY